MLSVAPGLTEAAAQTDTAAQPPTAGAPRAPLDVVTLVDNSGSMLEALGNGAAARSEGRAAAARVFVRAALEALAARLPADTRYALIAFDVSPRQVSGFGPLAAQRVETLRFDGQWTDLAAAFERALYELRTHGRAGARSVIVLVSDARIDLPQASAALDANRWLLDTLVADASNAGVQVVALVPAAGSPDYHVLQQVTRRTGGRYLLAERGDGAASAAELGALLARIPAPSAPAAASAAIEPAAADPDPVARAHPLRTPPVRPAATLPETLAETTRGWLAAMLPLSLAGVAIVAIVLLRRRRVPPAPGYFPDCYLRDLSHATGQARVPLRGRVNLITRMAAVREPGVHTIRIDDRHVGRRHAIVEFREHGFWLRDLKSLNGTFVNGQRITDTVQLRHGNFVRFHEFEFEYRDALLDSASETGFDPQPTPLRRPGRGR